MSVDGMELIVSEWDRDAGKGLGCIYLEPLTNSPFMQITPTEVCESNGLHVSPAVSYHRLQRIEGCCALGTV